MNYILIDTNPKLFSAWKETSVLSTYASGVLVRENAAD
jgi:hypothetical protein